MGNTSEEDVHAVLADVMGAQSRAKEASEEAFLARDSARQYNRNARAFLIATAVITGFIVGWSLHTVMSDTIREWTEADQ